MIVSVKDTAFHKLYELLAQEVRPRLLAIVGVFVLGAITAFGNKAPILLLEPLWTRVLFTGESAAEPVAELGTGRLAQSREQLTDWIFGPPGAADEMEVLAKVAGLLMLLTLLAGVSEYAFTWLSRWVSLRMIVDLRQRLARHLIGLSMRYHGDRRFGDLLSRVSNDVTVTLQSIQTVLKYLVQQPLLALGSLSVAFWIAPVPTVCMSVLLPLLAVPISLLGRKVRQSSNKSLSSLGSSIEILTQMFRGIRTVKAFRAEERELERYRATNEAYMDTSMKMVRAMASIAASTALLSNLGFMVLVVLVAATNSRFHFFTNGGQMCQFFVAISLVYTHIKSATGAFNKVQESAGAAERLSSLFQQKVDIVEREGAVRIESLGKGIAFEDVSFTYAGGARPAIDHLTLAVRPGETLALVGASGAGKTTLVDLIARFVDPSSGRILVDGHDLRDLSLDSWSRLYAMVGQVPFLFHASVRENILYGKPEATQAEIETAARAANIHDFIAGLPEGYDTLVGDQGARLSGGQRQRITIARAILKGAPLLLLDEATSALDSESEAVVQEALERLVQDRTVIVIAHRLSTIRNAHRIAVLEAGRLVEIGSHAELIGRHGVYARLHAVQFRDVEALAR
jgi:subfamily B ATP-binding cassette protein MsbA